MSTEEINEIEKKVTLTAVDGQIFEVEKSVCALSKTINGIIEDIHGDDLNIPLPNVTGPVLAKVLDYCTKHTEEKEEKICKGYDTELAESLKQDQEQLFGLILAANYLNIKGLLDLTTKTVADMIIGKSVEEIRETFKIVNDYTAEEEAKIREDYKWAFTPEEETNIREANRWAN
ncbi:hypothetical protein ACHQM5_027368 [Ranunculus cassubicifolius]